jgi:hypothetical protein
MDRLGIHKAALLTRFAIEHGIAPVGDALTDAERHDLVISPPPCAEIRIHGECESGENRERATG